MPRSVIWRHFTEIDSEKKVSCLHCSQQLSVANKSTCSLIRHMAKKHPLVKIRRHSSTEALEPHEEVLLVGNEDADGNTDSPTDPIMEYEVIETYSDTEEDTNGRSKKQSYEVFRKTKPDQNSVDQQVIVSMTEAKRKIGDAINCMKTLLPQRNDEDEYDHFGHMIACKLRKIQNSEQREILMLSVYKMVHETLMKNL